MSEQGQGSPADRSAADVAVSRAAVLLLKGVVARDSDGADWVTVTDHQTRLRDYLAVIGLELVIDEAEGFAFARGRQRSVGDEDDEPGDRSVPRLMARRALSFPVSLLLALLRKRLAEFDAHGGETRLVLSRNELVDLVRVFLPERADEARLFTTIDGHISKVVELGFLKRLGGSASGPPSFEVRRTIKAFVDAQWLSDFDAKLAQYRESLGHDLDSLRSPR